MVTRDDCSFTESVCQKSTVGLGAQKLLDNHINDISCKPLDTDGKRQFVILEPLAKLLFSSANPREASRKAVSF